MGELFREDVRSTLAEISVSTMPYGRYGPEKFPPRGVPIYDLPWEYLHWMARDGFPPGRLGQLLEVVYHMKSDGSDGIFDAFRRQRGGRHPLREAQERDRNWPEG